MFKRIFRKNYSRIIASVTKSEKGFQHPDELLAAFETKNEYKLVHMAIVKRLMTCKSQITRVLTIRLWRWLLRNGSFEFRNRLVLERSYITSTVKLMRDPVVEKEFMEMIVDTATLFKNEPGLQHMLEFAPGNTVQTYAEYEAGSPTSSPNSTMTKSFGSSNDGILGLNQIQKHIDITLTACEMFFEALNFNEGPIGENELVMILYQQLLTFQSANDRWIRKQRVTESGMEMLLSCNDRIISAILLLKQMVSEYEFSAFPNLEAIKPTSHLGVNHPVQDEGLPSQFPPPTEPQIEQHSPPSNPFSPINPISREYLPLQFPHPTEPSNLPSNPFSTPITMEPFKQSQLKPQPYHPHSNPFSTPMPLEPIKQSQREPEFRPLSLKNSRELPKVGLMVVNPDGFDGEDVEVMGTMQVVIEMDNGTVEPSLFRDMELKGRYSMKSEGSRVNVAVPESRLEGVDVISGPELLQEPAIQTNPELAQEMSPVIVQDPLPFVKAEIQNSKRYFFNHPPKAWTDLQDIKSTMVLATTELATAAKHMESQFSDRSAAAEVYLARGREIHDLAQFAINHWEPTVAECRNPRVKKDLSSSFQQMEALRGVLAILLKRKFSEVKEGDEGYLLSSCTDLKVVFDTAIDNLIAGELTKEQ